MDKYPVKIENLEPDIKTGRLVLIEYSDLNDGKLTPRKFYEYVDKGFIPVLAATKSPTTIKVGEYSFNLSHFVIQLPDSSLQYSITVTQGGTQTRYISTDLDEPYKK